MKTVVKKHIKDNIDKVNKYFLPAFHMAPNIGWMNDPNGFCHFKDEFHMFFQYHPFSSLWGPMYWGHFISKDLIKYEQVDVALAPIEKLNETHCFSGGSIVKDDTLNILYTRHYECDGIKSEEQARATSKDGKIFVQEKEILISSNNLPQGIVKNDFRDPNPVKINDTYYVFIGGKNDKNEGVIIIFKSDDFAHFEYDFIIDSIPELGDMGECPDYFRLESKDVLLVSSCNLKENKNNYKNINSSLALIGELDFIKKKFNIDTVQELDKGSCFYAPQTTLDKHGNRIMIAWLEMWGREYYTHVNDHKWCGMFTIPRKLSLVNGLVHQTIYGELDKYIDEYKKVENYSHISRTSLLKVDFEGAFQITLLGDNNKKILIGQDSNGIFVDDNNANTLNGCKRTTTNAINTGTLSILLDNSSIEVFIDNHYETLSHRMYIECDKYILNYEGKLSIEEGVIKV